MDSYDEQDNSQSNHSYYQTPEFRPASSISNVSARDLANGTSSTIPLSFERMGSPSFNAAPANDEENNSNYTAIIVGYSSSTQNHDNANEDNIPLQSEEEKQNPEYSDYNESDSEHKKSQDQRPNTSPARPLTEVEEFKRTKEFQFIEKAAILSAQIIQGIDNKFDLDSQEGQKVCKSFLLQIEKLITELHISIKSRKYRATFSQAYKALYKQRTICYLTEILDSAQEGFPYLWVNGEKFNFSEIVIRNGTQLFHAFCKLKQNIRHIYNRICEEALQINIKSTLSEISETLEDFDEKWVQFEQQYVMELMFIESEARKPITKAIQSEKAITEYEVKERTKGKIILDSEDYNKLRGKFVEICGKINSVANYDGKGRDDLTVDILMAAEQASRRVTCMQSNAVRKLADQIKKSFANLRALMQKYDQSIEVVDPQLKNNSDLVECLMDFESSWEKGKDYFIKPSTLNDLIVFSQLIEGLAEKYESVRAQIETMETDLFMYLPKVLILKCIDDRNYSLLKYFNPSLDYSEGSKLEELQQLYDTIDSECSEFDCYNYLEESLLEVKHSTELSNSLMQYADKFIQITKIVSVGIQRFNPTEWNNFIMASLGNVCAGKSI